MIYLSMSRDAFDKWLLASGLSLSYYGIVHDRTQTAFLKFLFPESHYLDKLAKASYTNPCNWTPMPLAKAVEFKF